MSARLIDVQVPRSPRGAVIVLHGGASRRDSMMVSPTQLSVLRMIPVARRIAHADRRGLAVHRLLNSRRGWDTEHTPLDDALRAIGEVRERHGDLPVGLVGHSLGGRAALLAAGRARIAGVVALNPYLLPHDILSPDASAVAIVHGTLDRIASPRRAEQLVAGPAGGARTGLVRVVGGKHAMLRRGRTFERLAADLVAAFVLHREPRLDAAAALLGGSRVVDV